jgi:hypothetical protein
MIKTLAKLLLVIVPLVFSATANASEKLKPFILAFESDNSLEITQSNVTAKLTKAGFEVVGTHSPYAGTVLLVATNDALKDMAGQSKFGGYGAAQRVSLSTVNGKVQVSYANPLYTASAFRLSGDLAETATAMAAALGAGTPFGADGITAEDLREYHYMFGMEYFDEPSNLARYDTYDMALAAVEEGLAANISGISKVYRIDIPGKNETVFGVAMDGSKGEGEMQDDAFIMGVIDFADIKSSAHLPYEILVAEGKVYSLYARFRIAMSFPDLSMMGSNSFMSIMGAPDAIQRALTSAVGGEMKEKRKQKDKN